MNQPLVIITSRGHIPRMHAHQILLDNHYSNWMMVVDDKEQADRIIDVFGVVMAPRIIIASTPSDIPRMDRIAWVREFIERELVTKGSWYVSLDDNVKGWTYLPEPYCNVDKIDLQFDEPQPGHKWRTLFETPCPFERVVHEWNKLMDACIREHTEAGGFAVETNFFFRGRKWQRLGYVRAQNAVWRNTGLPFYYWRGAMLEDYIRSVDVVARCGSILNNRFVKPIKQFFEPGGIGSFEERKPALIACSTELMNRYPGLLRPNKGQDYQLTFVPRTQAGVDKWRREHNFL